MAGVVDGPSYRMFDPKRMRWVMGRDACIDVLVRNAMNIECGPLAIAATVRAWWPRAVFR